MKQYHIILSGRVQNVGFRYFTLMKANLHQVNGWVRNKEDGDVEMVVEGEQEQLTSFINDVKNGNTFASINQMDILEKELDYYNTFTIR